METFIGIAGIVFSALVALFTGLQLKRTTDSSFDIVATLTQARNKNDLDCITLSFVNAKVSFVIRRIEITGFQIMNERTGAFTQSMNKPIPLQVNHIILNGLQAKVVSQLPSIELWGKVLEDSELIKIRISHYSWPFSILCFWASFTVLLSVNKRNTH